MHDLKTVHNFYFPQETKKYCLNDALFACSSVSNNRAAGELIKSLDTFHKRGLLLGSDFGLFLGFKKKILIIFRF